jgi:hypothetical protein
MRKVLFFFFPLTLSLSTLCGQDLQTLRFKKHQELIYFYQKGQASTTLIPGKNDVFYLLVPDTLKPFLLIAAENAELILQPNDSLVVCKSLPGIRYEHYYQRGEENNFIYKVGVNGASVLRDDEILIQFTDKRSGRLIFENRYRASSN